MNTPFPFPGFLSSARQPSNGPAIPQPLCQTIPPSFHLFDNFVHLRILRRLERFTNLQLYNYIILVIKLSLDYSMDKSTDAPDAL